MRQGAHTVLLDSHTGSHVDLDEDIARRLPFGPVELVAEGGMALVYRGRAADGPVAIKVLRSALAGHADHVAAFEAERGVIDRIGHPSVVPVRDSGAIDGVPYLVMDWCDGQTLAERVAFEPMSLWRVAAVGARLATAIDAIHQAGVVHCDIKPENVMLTDDGGVRVLDFGVARLADGAPVESHLVSGTPSYMSPEQWLGSATPASDVYSLGCLLFELVTGAPPFTGGFAEIMCGHQSDERPSVLEHRPDLSPALAALITSMLAKAPQDRPSAAEVAAELRCAGGLTSRPSGHARPARTPAFVQPALAG